MQYVQFSSFLKKAFKIQIFKKIIAQSKQTKNKVVIFNFQFIGISVEMQESVKSVTFENNDIIISLT